MPLFTEDQLRARAVPLTANRSANVILAEAAKAFEATPCDIFLSHRFVDADAVLGLRETLRGLGYSVYVDWIDDPQLDRTRVNRDTAEKLRARLRSCRSLFFAVSKNSEASVWMPWELGFVDGRNGKVAIVPVLKSVASTFAGQEYLSLYPYVDEFLRFIYMNQSGKSAELLQSWLPLK